MMEKSPLLTTAPEMVELGKEAEKKLTTPAALRDPGQCFLPHQPTLSVFDALGERSPRTSAPSPRGLTQKHATHQTASAA
jgi:hypothetical protein